jgi:hypothetical protein
MANIRLRPIRRLRTTVIDTLVIDITALPTPSIGGNTQYLTIIEETSGTYGIHGTIPKK